MSNPTQRHLLAAFLIALALGIAGSIGVNDEQAEQDQYCQMVADGLWPEYRNGEVICGN